MKMRYIATSADVAKGLFIQNFHSRDWEFLSAKYLGQKDNIKTKQYTKLS